ncbi:hypothetical protein KSC_077290 [Ktedonobacter sp. SOSP1-52]|uniref:mannosyltransferase family protein n=1 Tax=Ktedonobacter sp. SOSP1-52 TaxID=2778366 RepID=UPI001915E516|nr:mannosyltransferase family protein [Ktedonobacter sp. SOSP1-52]GHO68837.1 hypothetical protein KSC_077290 [Ktedonobacter sp. SOSP1-52]
MSIQHTPSAITTDSSAPVTRSPRQAWNEFLSPWWQATRNILFLYIITRLIFLLLTYFGGVLFNIPNYSYDHLSFNTMLHTWYRWDAIRFITIATSGYTKVQNAAFFPLYPALVALTSKIIPTHSILVASMLVSNVATLGMMVMLYRFVEMEFSRELAQRTVFYQAIFPTAFFFFAGYNESLFIFLMLGCFYALRRGAWWFAGVFGFLAAMSRSIAILLFVIFFCEYVRQRWPELRPNLRPVRPVALLKHIPHLLPALLIPLGLIVYMLGLYVRLGDPLAFSHAQVDWRTGAVIPGMAIYQSLQQLVVHSPLSFSTPHILIDLGTFIAFLVLFLLAIFGRDRLPRDQWPLLVFWGCALLYAILWPGVPGAPGQGYDPMPSTQRFVLELFMAFIILARLGERSPKFHQAYLLLSLPFLTFLTLQFMTGHWTV